MSHPSGEYRKQLMQACADRDTEGKIVCIAPVRGDKHPCRGEVLLHHKDNNASNNHAENLENLCRGHNARADARGPQINPRFNSFKLLQHSVSEKRRRKPFEMMKSEKADRFCRSFIQQLFQSVGEVRVDDLIDAVRQALANEKNISVDQGTLFKTYRSMRNPINGELEEFPRKAESDDEESAKEETWVRLRK